MKTGKVAGVLACLCLGLLTACQQTKSVSPISSLPGPIIPVQNPNPEPGGTGVGLPIGSVPPGQPSPLVPPPVSAPAIPPLPTPNPSPSIVGLPPGPLAAPTFTKQFVPNSTTNGNAVTVVFTITNTATVPITGLNFIDILPDTPASGLRIRNPAVTSNTCGGTLTAPNGGVAISLAGGSLAAGASCVVSVSVEQAPPLPPPPPLPVTYTNPSVTLFSSGAPPATSAPAAVTFTP